MSDPTMTNIDLFFEDHETYPPPPREYSVLYFLRRDIGTCMRTNPDPHRALFAAAMVIFAGMDLLGKFLAGDDSFERGKSRERFENFFKEYFQTVSQDDAEIIYQLRNALMHSFGLYSRDRQGNEYWFRLKYNQTGGPLVSRQGSNLYFVDVQTLQNLFKVAITRYETDLRQAPSLRENFAAMFPKYGAIWQR